MENHRQKLGFYTDTHPHPQKREIQNKTIFKKSIDADFENTDSKKRKLNYN